MAKPTSNGWRPIYEAVKRIPRGRVITYGQLARLLKIRGGARVVGYAMAGCPSGQGIPWHRVVGAGGRLLPHEPYASKQRMLLETEGAPFAGMKVDLAACLWIPANSRSLSPRRSSRKRKSPRKSPRRAKPDSRKPRWM